MIEFRQVTKQYGAQTVLGDVSFTINRGERVGIVGPNGAGKSTVCSLIVEELGSDKGTVTLPRGLRLGYVRQQLPFVASTVTLLDYTENAVPALLENQHAIEALEQTLSAETEPAARERLLRRLGELQSEFEHAGGYTLKTRAEVTLGGLGFPVEDLHRLLADFSGGWQMRAELSRALVADPELLLLDEPSNYLDIPAVEWLEAFLENYRGTLLLISHDRFLLNKLTTVTLEVANGRVARYPGNYDYYAREREVRLEQSLAAQKNQDRKREQLERFVERFRAKNTFATRAKSKMKMIERMEEIETPQRIVSRGRIRLRPPPHCGHEIVRLDGAGLTYDGTRWVLRGVDLRIEKGEKLALVGLNGMGKSTLLRLLGGSLPLSEGRRVVGHNVAVGYQSQDFAETMDPDRTVFDTLKGFAPELSEQETRTLLGGFGFSGDNVEKRVAVLSGGEKVRLAFARLLARPPNFLILDEPTTHLDIAAREALEQALQDYAGTLCIVSHDIEFVRRVATGIISMRPPGIRRWPGSYDYYHEKSTAEATRVQAAAPTARRDRDPATDKKAARRERAKQRQELYTRTRDLKKLLAKCEEHVARFEGERDGLLAQIAAAAPGADYAALNQRLASVQTLIEQYTQRWEGAAGEMAKIEAACADEPGAAEQEPA